MKKVVLLALVACFTSSIVTANESHKTHGDAGKGKVLSASCAACHGADGNSANPAWPKLAGQGQAYLVKQLNDFRQDKRADPTMTGQAKGIASDEDVMHLAAYFSSNTIKAGTAKKDKLDLGRAIYKGGVMSSGVAACAACHGPSGDGNTAAKFPKISGQHSQYTINQLKSFKAGKRENDNGKMMRNVALKMTDAEMEAVAEYIAGLHD